MKGRDDRHRLTVAGKLFWEYYTYRFASAIHPETFEDDVKKLK